MISNIFTTTVPTCVINPIQGANHLSLQGSEREKKGVVIATKCSKYTPHIRGAKAQSYKDVKYLISSTL
jgi:hypothetical protein